MGSPYLSKGESITLTTHRVDVESVPYDVMLTTHRLTLIDSRYARFEPLMIAFEDILTVKSGTASTGEPVIILTYTGADESAHVMNLVFLQQAGEHRKDERDIWVKKLMESIIAGRERTAEADAETAPEPGPMKASIRRWVAPEGISLHTPFAVQEPDQPEFTIIPDEEGDLLEGKNLQTPAPDRELPDPQDSTGPEEEPVPAAPEVTGTSRPAPEYDYGITEDEGDTAFTPVPGEDPDPLQKFQTIVIPFASLEKPDASIPPSGKIQEEPQKISEDLILAGARSFDRKEPAEDGIDEESRPDRQAGMDFPSEIETGTPAAAAPASSQAEEKAACEDPGETISREEGLPAGSGISETAGTPMPPAEEQKAERKEPGPPGRTKAGGPRVVTILLILIAVLVLAGIGIIVFSYSGIPGADQGSSAIPAVTQKPAATPAVLTIPAIGAGFRVTYDGDFAGTVGNPAQMKPVTGTGDIFYPVQEYNGIVQASIQKRDNSGRTLTIEVYNNAKMIYTRNVSTPGGSLDILLDTRSGTIAGMTPVKPVATLTVQSTPMYF